MKPLVSARSDKIVWQELVSRRLISNVYHLISKSESVGKPSSVADGYLSRRGIAPCAQAAFRNTPGRRIVTVSVAPNRVYRVLTFP